MNNKKDHNPTSAVLRSKAPRQPKRTWLEMSADSLAFLTILGEIACGNIVDENRAQERSTIDAGLSNYSRRRPA